MTLTVRMVSPFRIADRCLGPFVSNMHDVNFFALAIMLFWSHHSDTMSIDDCMFCVV